VALKVVSEVAGHANEAMKQHVSIGVML